MAELIYRRATIPTDGRREIGEVGQPAAAVSERRIGFEPQISRARFPIAEVGDGENYIPELDPMLLARTTDRFKVGPITLAHGAVIHERIVVVADYLRVAGGDEP